MQALITRANWSFIRNNKSYLYLPILTIRWRTMQSCSECLIILNILHHLHPIESHNNRCSSVRYRLITINHYISIVVVPCINYNLTQPDVCYDTLCTFSIHQYTTYCISAGRYQQTIIIQNYVMYACIERIYISVFCLLSV